MSNSFWNNKRNWIFDYVIFLLFSPTAWVSIYVFFDPRREYWSFIELKKLKSEREEKLLILFL